MMARRLKVFEFRHQWQNPVKVHPCAACFARMLLQGQTAPIPATGLKRTTQEEATGAPEAKASCMAWGILDVTKYLDSLDLGHLSGVFRNNAVDGPFLSSLSLQDLVSELGCSNLQARKILNRMPKAAN